MYSSSTTHMYVHRFVWRKSPQDPLKYYRMTAPCQGSVRPPFQQPVCMDRQHGCVELAFWQHLPIQDFCRQPRVSWILEFIPPNRWHHVSAANNPADCASRGLFPSELLVHQMWWSGPEWLHKAESECRVQPELQQGPVPAEEKYMSLLASLAQQSVLPTQERFSSCTHMKCNTAWIFRFIGNCRQPGSRNLAHLSVDEMLHAVRYWLTVAQRSSYTEEIASLLEKRGLSKKVVCYPSIPSLTCMGFYGSVDKEINPSCHTPSDIQLSSLVSIP